MEEDKAAAVAEGKLTKESKIEEQEEETYGEEVADEEDIEGMGYGVQKS